MRISRSLKSILTFNFVVAATLPILAIGLISLNILTVSMEKEITGRNFFLAKSLAGEVERFLEEPLHILTQIEDVIDGKELILADDINTYLDSVISNYRFFDMLRIVGHEGKVEYLAPYNEDLLRADMTGQAFFQVTAQLNRPYWSTTFISMHTGQPALTLSIPVKQGILAGYLNLAILNSVIAKVKIGLHGYAWITDRDGTIIAHPNKSFISQRTKVKYLSGIQQALHDNEGTFEYHVEGSDRLGSAVIVPQTHWIVAVTQPVEEAYASLKKIRTILLTGTSAALALALLIALSSLKKTLQPLSQLTEHSQRIAAGDYHLTLPPKHYREINELAQNFHVMVEAVKGRENRLRETEEQLKKMNAELQRSNQELEQFAYVASHDLQEPLRMVASYTKLFEKRFKEQVDEKADTYIQYIVGGATRMQDLINDLLVYSRISTQAEPLQLTESQAILNNVLASLEAAIQESGALVTHNDLPEVRADALQLERMFQNLIANAIKFRGEDPPRIHVSTQSTGNEWLFCVQDNGIGLEPQYKDKIFVIFQRLHSRRAYPGTGIGLAICKRIINRHGGTIRVESEPGKGAMFYFTLPKVM